VTLLSLGQDGIVVFMHTLNTLCAARA